MSGENCINHIALVLDASASMTYRKKDLIRVADEQVKYLARRSQELDQETRVTVYSFDDRVTCLIYDKDVLRLPSIATLYSIGGNTALIDATIQSQEDLALTPEKYGDHAFLTFVLTDGEENRSRRSAFELQRKLNSLPDNWTVAVLVPDQRAKFEAKRFGFHPDNIAVWDVNSASGVEEVGRTIRTATDNFMAGRAQGIRSTRTLFSTGIDAVNATTVRGTLKPLAAHNFKLLDVPGVEEIRPFVNRHGYNYTTGKAYYQLSKTEHIQPQKALAVLEESTGKVYVGAQARELVGLGTDLAKVKPDFNPDYKIFVQSTSVNRKLMPNTKLLLLT